MGANGSMLFSVVRIALEELVAHKGRSLLTMLGIVVGVAAVIAMVSLGQGAQEQVQQQIASMGTNMLIVSAGSQNTGGLRSGAGTSTTLTPADAEAILREAPAVGAISPSVGAGVTLVFGNQNWSTRAEGVGTSYPQIRNRGVALGRVLQRRRCDERFAGGGDRADGGRTSFSAAWTRSGRRSGCGTCRFA